MSKSKDTTEIAKWLPCSRLIDYENRPYQTLLVIFLVRFITAMVFGEKNFHPDQSWQG